MTSRMAAKFLKVEEFFEGYQGWGKVTTLNSCVLDGARKALKLVLNHDNGTTSNALLQFVQRDTLRVRWNPVEGPHVYSANNTALRGNGHHGRVAGGPRGVRAGRGPASRRRGGGPGRGAEPRAGRGHLHEGPH